jgi:probable phosphoglycerate mutase
MLLSSIQTMVCWYHCIIAAKGLFMTQLYLIRHGQALTQVNSILNDYGLTELGVKQAEHLRDRLAGSGEIKADLLIASTFPRARQTAEIIAPALNLPIIFDEEVQEIRPGGSRGMHIDEFRALEKKYIENRNSFVGLAPGSESWAQFVLRVGTALNRILNEHEGKTIVIVCHGGVIDTSFSYFFGIDMLHSPRAGFYTHNTSITHWRKIAEDAGRGPLYWRLISYNDDAHLRDLDVPTRIPWRALRPEQHTEQEDQPPVALAEE